MSELVEAVGSRVLDAGLWKFYGVFSVFLLSFIMNFFDKNRGWAEKLVILSSVMIMSICLFFIVIGHAAQLIL